jgi:hypothetical protein
MATAKTAAKKRASTAASKRKAAKAPGTPLVLKRETVADLQAMLKQTTRIRQSRKVCIA